MNAFKPPGLANRRVATRRLNDRLAERELVDRGPERRQRREMPEPEPEAPEISRDEFAEHVAETAAIAIRAMMRFANAITVAAISQEQRNNEAAKDDDPTAQ